MVRLEKDDKCNIPIGLNIRIIHSVYNDVQGRYKNGRNKKYNVTKQTTDKKAEVEIY